MIFTRPPKIMNGTQLHVYKFQYDGTVNYSLCAVTKVWDDYGRKKLQFKPVATPSDFIGYAYQDEIDRHVGRVQKTMIAVMSSPDFELAKQVVLADIQESIDRKEFELARIKSHMEVLKDAEDPFEEV